LASLIHYSLDYISRWVEENICRETRIAVNESIKDIGINRFWGEMKPEIKVKTEQDCLDEIFEKCVKRTYKDGWHTIKCKLKLWSTSGGDENEVERTAKNYWRQYFEDGEYDKLLKL